MPPQRQEFPRLRLLFLRFRICLFGIRYFQASAMKASTDAVLTERSFYASSCCIRLNTELTCKVKKEKEKKNNKWLIGLLSDKKLRSLFLLDTRCSRNHLYRRQCPPLPLLEVQYSILVQTWKLQYFERTNKQDSSLPRKGVLQASSRTRVSMPFSSPFSSRWSCGPGERLFH